MCPNANKHSLKPITHQAVYGKIPAQSSITHYFNTMLTNTCYLFIQHILGQPILWYPIPQHPTSLRQCLKDCAPITHTCQIIGTTQGCRTCTNKSYLLTHCLLFTAYFRIPHFAFRILPLPICDKPLQKINGNWLINQVTSTCQLTWSHTNPAANRWQWIVLFYNSDSLLIHAITYQINIIPDPYPGRTGCLTRRQAITIMIR